VGVKRGRERKKKNALSVIRDASPYEAFGERWEKPAFRPVLKVFSHFL